MFPRRTAFGVFGRLIRNRAAAPAIVFSMVVHAVLIAALVSWRMDVGRRPERLSESGSSTVLDFTAERPAEPVETREHKPEVPPAPQPPPEPLAEKPAPEPMPVEKVEAVAEVSLAPAARDVAAPAKVDVATNAVRVAVHDAGKDEPEPKAEPVAKESKVTFAGVESKRAKRIVYAIDASGSMASSLPFVKAELARSVAKLEASQSFAVVVFREKLRGGEETETFGAGGALVAATPAAKAELTRWIGAAEPSGRSSPVAGLRAAMGLKPDLVLLLTRNIRRSGKGEAEGNASVLTALNALNPLEASGQRAVVVKVVQFVEDDPTGLMQAIGELHGDGAGSYRVVPVQ